jgi:hypothetical protein
MNGKEFFNNLLKLMDIHNQIWKYRISGTDYVHKQVYMDLVKRKTKVLEVLVQAWDNKVDK